MPRDWRECLDDILDSAHQIGVYIEGMTFDEFPDDRRTFDAVLHNFAVIGEAANRLPYEIRSQFPSVPWHDMVGMRIIIVHIYFRVSGLHVWRAVAELPTLIQQIEDHLASPHIP